MGNTFVKVGDRVSVYQGGKFEGRGRVVSVNKSLSDTDFAHVDVWFDEDEEQGAYPRWISPEHVENHEHHN